METKKLSRTVLKRLKKKGIVLPTSTDVVKKLSEESPTITQKITVLPETPDIIQKKSSAKKKKKKSAKAKKQIDEVEQKPESTAIPAVKADDKPTVAPTGKRHRKHDPKDKVAYINRSYVSNDANDIGGLIQAELIGLRKQSKSIKSASDLTENQAHVIKRQITRIQEAEPEREFKRPKHYDKTLGEAAVELARLLQNQKSKPATSS